MVLKNVCAAIICAVPLMWSSVSIADEYKPDEYKSGDFLGPDFDLSKAVLSPKRLGPDAEFAPLPVQARTDRASESAQSRVEPEARAKPEARQARVKIVAPEVVVRKVVVPKTHLATRVETRVAHVRAEKPRGAARTRLARRHGNPLDAQAHDTRIQRWPCKSGGICDWQR